MVIMHKQPLMLILHVLHLQFLNASLTAVNSIRVLDSKDFFQSNQLPKLGAPFNINFQYS